MLVFPTMENTLRHVQRMDSSWSVFKTHSVVVLSIYESIFLGLGFNLPRINKILS